MAQFAKEESVYANPVPRLADPAAKMYVTTGLLAINVIVYLAMLFDGGSITDPSGDILVRFGGSWGTLTIIVSRGDCLLELSCAQPAFCILP